MRGAIRDLKKLKTIHHQRMAYIEEGSGDLIVFRRGRAIADRRR